MENPWSPLMARSSASTAVAYHIQGTTFRAWWGRIINCTCIACMVGVDSLVDSCGVDNGEGS
jgi:hypothetical protein